MSAIDIALTLNSNNIYDINIASNGDLETTKGYDTAILMSVISEKRANEDEVTKPEYRRGDWSNELNDIVDFEVGSKLWLLDYARTTQESIDKGIEYINDGLQWMIDDDLIKEVETTGEISQINRSINFTVLITRPDNKTEKKLFTVFKNTGA